MDRKDAQIDTPLAHACSLEVPVPTVARDSRDTAMVPVVPSPPIADIHQRDDGAFEIGIDGLGPLPSRRFIARGIRSECWQGVLSVIEVSSGRKPGDGAAS